VQKLRQTFIQSNGHCGPYSDAFTLVIRQCKQNPNPKPGFSVFKTETRMLTQSPGLTKSQSPPVMCRVGR